MKSTEINQRSEKAVAQSKQHNLYKQLLEERSSVIGGYVDADLLEDTSSQFQHSSLKKLALRPKKRHRVIDDD